VSAALRFDALPASPSALAADGDAGWLRALPHWPRAALRSVQRDGAVVRVLVAAVRGSAPRDAGAVMLVDTHGIQGSIGGGHLEWQAVAAARELLTGAVPGRAGSARVQRFVLGRELAQCCGGVVDLWLDRYDTRDLAWLSDAAEHGGTLHSRLRADGHVERQRRSSVQSDVDLQASADGGYTLIESISDTRTPVWLYGAGHVGQAIARAIADLPLRLTWIDSRADAFPQRGVDDIDLRCAADPAATVAQIPPGARVLVLTHDHAQDYALCRALLRRGDLAFIGLIGSASKAARFRSRLAREDGYDDATMVRLTCPIGVAGIASKWPAAIAVAVAAQLLQTLTMADAAAPTPMPPLDDCSATGCNTCR